MRADFFEKSEPSHTEAARVDMLRWTRELRIVSMVPALFALSTAAFGGVPEEYDSTGGNSLAFGGSVVTATAGSSAVRSNPGLLSLEKQYSVNGAYHWPTAGRDFYQLGVVDGKTSSVAAGFSYTGSMDQYQGVWSDKRDERENSLLVSEDSPVARRAALAFSMPVGKFFVGASGGYVEAYPPVETFSEEGAQLVKGFTLGAGMAAHLTQAIRVGVSAENLANKKVQFAAPTYYRAGASYFFGDVAVVSLDYRRREAVAAFEGSAPSMLLAPGQSAAKPIDAENLYAASGAVKIYDLLNVIAAAGAVNSAGGQRGQMSGGLSLNNQKFNFTYQAHRRDMAKSAVHHALSCGFDISL